MAPGVQGSYLGVNNLLDGASSSVFAINDLNGRFWVIDTGVFDVVVGAPTKHSDVSNLE